MSVRAIYGTEMGPQSASVDTPIELWGTSKVKAITSWKRSGSYATEIAYNEPATNNHNAKLYLHARAPLTDIHRYITFALRVRRDGSADYSDAVAVIGWPSGWFIYVLDASSTTCTLVVGDGTTWFPAAATLNYDQEYIISWYWRDQSGTPYHEIKVDNVSKQTRTDAVLYKNIQPAYCQIGRALGKNFTAKAVPAIDDVWVSDGAGGGGWPPYPLPKVVDANVNDDGTLETSGWTGSPDETDKWKNWDDAPPYDADSSYNESGTGTSEESLLSELESSSGIGLATNDTIKAVASVFVAKVTTGSNGTPAIIVRDSGTVYETTLPTGDLDQNSYLLGGYMRVDEVMPGGAGGSWTQARFDSFQSGLRRKSAVAPMRNLRSGMMRVMVAYGADGAGGTPFGEIPSDQSVAASFSPTDRRFGAVPSDETVNPASGARRWGAVPSDEQVPDPWT